MHCHIRPPDRQSFSALVKTSGVTRGWDEGRTAPGDTLQGGDIRRKKILRVNLKELWTNEVGLVKKLWVTPSKGVTPSEISKSDSD